MANVSRTTVAKALGVKLPATAYFIYMSDRRAAFTAENPNMSPKDVVRNLAQQWRELSDSDRASFVGRATEDRARFDRELEAAREAHGDAPLPEVPTRNRREKKQKRVTAAKLLGVAGPKTAYILFGSSVRPKLVKKNPDASQRDILRLISAEWKKAKASVKARFTKQATADRERYQTELAAAREANPELVAQLGGKKNRTGPKRARSAYLFFCTAMRTQVKEANPELGVRDLTRRLGQMWRELNEAGRQQYVEQATADRERYQRERDAAAATTGSNTTIPAETREEVSRNVESRAASTTRVKKVVRRRRARKTGTSTEATA